MNLKIKTEDLQELVSKSLKGVGNKKLVPLTSCIDVRLCDNVLTLITFDGDNYLYVSSSQVNGDDFEAVINANMFGSLISKTTSEYVEFTLTDKSLDLKGNGKYSIPLEIDTDGKNRVFSDPYANFSSTTDSQTLSVEDVLKVRDSLSYSLAPTFVEPCYTNYYFGESTISTDSLKVSCIKARLLKDSTKDILIKPATITQLTLFNPDEDIVVNEKDDYSIVVYTQPNIVLYTATPDGIDDYKVDIISQLINIPFDSSCTISKSKLLSTLDRIALFIEHYEENEINITFTSDQLEIFNNKGNFKETISYESSNVSDEFTGKINKEILQTLVKTIKDSSLSIEFGQPNSIKLNCGDIIHIIALNT